MRAPSETEMRTEIEIPRRHWWVFGESTPVMVSLSFQPSTDPARFGEIMVRLHQPLPEGYEYKGEREPRRRPRTTELKLTVSSNFVARGPMQPWELEVLTPLIREFILEIVAEQERETASVSVLVERIRADGDGGVEPSGGPPPEEDDDGE